MADEGTARGAYGLRLLGLASSEPLVAVGDALRWPSVTITRTTIPGFGGPARIDSGSAVVEMLDGDRAVIDRHARTATYLAADERLDGRLVHPFLTAVGTMFAWWQGHHAFHGGGFIAGGGAWGVLGAREAGKSSLLAALSMAGRSIVSDDLLVIAGGRALAGPRSIDLREGVAAALGLESPPETVRGGQRFRILHGSIAPEALMRGWIFPSWGADLQMRRMSPRERLTRLSAHSCVPSLRSQTLMDLIALPAYELIRPRDWTSLGASVERVIAAADA